MKRQAWTAHDFNLGLDPGWVFNIISRLEDTALRLRHHSSSLSEEKLQMKPNGGWSIKEHIGHLIDLEPLHHFRLKEFLTFETILSAADMANMATEKANHNAIDLEFLLTKFEKSRSAFIQEYRNLPENCLHHQALHPRLKVLMKPVDLLFFIAEHDDHHMRSIKEIPKGS